MQQMIGLEWIPETIIGNTDGEYPLYMAYFRCHDIDWELPENKATYRSSGDEIHVSIMNKVEISVPEMALIPDVRHQSAGLEASLGRHGVNAMLDKDALHIGVGVKLPDASPQSILDGTNLADRIAATSAIALGQALGIRKVAAYVAMIAEGRLNRPKSFMYSFRAPGPAVFDAQAKDELAIAVSNLGASPNEATEAAISRYESSKGMTVEADRILALWMALERLARGVKERMSDWYRETEELSCNAVDEPHNHGSLNFDFYRKLRNRIVHTGLTTVDPPWNGSGLLVSRAQLLDAFCSEGIRIALGMSPTGEVHRQLKIAADNPLAKEQLVK